MNDAVIFEDSSCSQHYSVEKNIIEQSIKHFCNPNVEILQIFDFNKIYPHSAYSNTAFVDNKGNFVLTNERYNFSKTAKVVMKDDFVCKQCYMPVNYVAVGISHVDNAPKPSIYFGHLDYEQRHFTIMTKDHIIPKAEGGNNSMLNLQCLCYDCNQMKADKVDIGPESKPHDIFRHRIDENDPRLSHKKRRRTYIKVDEEEYNEMRTKVKDFYETRKNIKRAINKLPWYYRILGVHKHIEKKIKQSLDNKGYYKNGGK